MIKHSHISEPAVALVVAAGSGTRLGADLPKALVPLAGRSLLAHSVSALAAGGISEAVVVIPEGDEPRFARALSDAPIPVRLVDGGSQRQISVRHGLLAYPDHRGPILVHDAARPLVPATVVAAVIAAIREGAQAVAPVVAVADTIRRLVDGDSEIVDRSQLRAVQTPQGFAPEVLRQSHALAEAREWSVTDDISACEAAGYRVALIEGSADSLKITTPADLIMAAAMLAARA